MKNVVAIVPIKLKNTRLPGKNTKILDGKPLLSYILKNLNESQRISRIVVCCSDMGLKHYLPEYVDFLHRPIELDQDDANFTELFSFIQEQIMADIFVYAHATAPFISTASIDKCIMAVAEEGFDSAFSAKKFQDYLWSSAFTPVNFDPSLVPRSQDLPVLFRETSGIYAFTNDLFVENKRRIGTNPKAIEVDWIEAIDINEQEDFDLATLIITKAGK